MAKKDTLFTVAGITTHTGTAPNGTVSTRTKVRYGTDLVRVTKMLNNPKKIEDQTLGICLAPVRVEFVTLPKGMVKADVLQFLLTAPEFQSAEDQAVIQEEISARAPKTPRTPKTPKAPKVKATKAKPSIDSIKSRGKKSVTAEQVVAAALAAEATAE
jgi:hypothetical protein